MLFHKPTEEIERDVILLLTELAERRHAGDCDGIEVRWLTPAGVVEGLVFKPRPDRLEAGISAQWERDTLAHWLRLRPDLDSVTVIVRSYGKAVATLVLEPHAMPAATD